jgi:isopenicillin N synthase-like dioxygenase
MATGTLDILDVDLLRYERGDADARRAVVDGVARSLRTGFVYCRHDIPEEVVDRAYEGLARFFHLPREEKERHVVAGSRGQTGYTGLLVETAASEATPDWKEMLNWGPEVPEGHPLRRRFPHRYMPRVFPEEAVPGIGAALTTLYDRLFDLQRRFLRVVAEGVGAAAGFFDGMLENGPTLCRALRYPPMAEAPGNGHVWAGAHGDINLVTALPRATERGLQVEVEGAWVDAVPPAGLAVLNSGLMLERLTNGRIPAGIHRVVAEPGSTRERFSVVQFCHPTPWTVLAPLACCIDGRHPQREGAILAGDWLDQVLYDINLVEDARRVP